MPPSSALWRASLYADIREREAMTGGGSFEKFYTGAVSLAGRL
jgi:hypothetical protein